jgi:hypothetical protein
MHEKRSKSVDPKEDQPVVQPETEKKSRYINYLPTLSLKKLDDIDSVVRTRKDKDTKMNLLIGKSNEL